MLRPYFTCPLLLHVSLENVVVVQGDGADDTIYVHGNDDGDNFSVGQVNRLHSVNIDLVQWKR